MSITAEYKCFPPDFQKSLKTVKWVGFKYAGNMKSRMKSYGLKGLRWFVNSTGLIDDPRKVSSRMMVVLWIILVGIMGVSIFANLSPVVETILSIVPLVILLIMMSIMLLSIVLEVNQGNSKIRRHLDSSQSRISQYSED